MQTRDLPPSKTSVTIRSQGVAHLAVATHMLRKGTCLTMQITLCRQILRSRSLFYRLSTSKMNALVHASKIAKSPLSCGQQGAFCNAHADAHMCIGEEDSLDTSVNYVSDKQSRPSLVLNVNFRTDRLSFKEVDIGLPLHEKQWLCHTSQCTGHIPCVAGLVLNTVANNKLGKHKIARLLGQSHAPIWNARSIRQNDPMQRR
jgi:hypothetical protein